MDDLVQRSPEWFKFRLGRVTASRIADLMATTKSGPSASRMQYRAELLRERWTGQPVEHYQSFAMQQGTEREPEARRVYSFKYNVDIVEIGVVPHPTILMASASPDGLVGDDGTVEIKCPTVGVHLDTLLNESIPGNYMKQMQFGMACSGRAWVDYVSYDPGMPLFVKRVMRDKKMIAEIEQAVRDFLVEVDQAFDQMRRKYG